MLSIIQDTVSSLLKGEQPRAARTWQYCKVRPHSQPHLWLLQNSAPQRHSGYHHMMPSRVCTAQQATQHQGSGPYTVVCTPMLATHKRFWRE
jgi:hypothetical protein